MGESRDGDSGIVIVMIQCVLVEDYIIHGNSDKYFRNWFKFHYLQMRYIVSESVTQLNPLKRCALVGEDELKSGGWRF